MNINFFAYRLYHSNYVVHKILERTSSLWSDSLYLRIKYRLVFGKWLNLKNPHTFSEKLQWLKLYDRRPEYTVMVDKVKAKEYVANIIGEEYIIPTLGVWDSADDVDFDSLPNQFVIKCNHNSGLGMYICKDRSKMDVDAVREGLRKGLKQNYYLKGREWPYKNVPRKILAEKFMVEKGETELEGKAALKAAKLGNLRDYKIYCFNGEPKLVQVISDRAIDECIDFYDTDWNRIEGLTGLSPKVHTSNKDIARPASLSDMLRCAAALAKDIPFSRIDFYDIDGKLYWGEITFFPACGFGRFRPNVWNITIGDMIKLPNKDKTHHI